MRDLGKVTEPWHYQHNGIETIDVIEAWTADLPGDVAYSIGNAIKYLSRWNKKNGEKDLLKVLWYVSRALELHGMGVEALETVKAVRRKHEEPLSNNPPADPPARGINFQDD